VPQPTHPKAPRPVPSLAPPPAVPPGADPLPAYAELHCRSNFSFLVGASHPQELVARAAQLGYTALAITDECSVAGVVRAHEEARRQADAGSALRLIVGSEFTLEGSAAQPGCRLVLLAHCAQGAARRAHRRAPGHAGGPVRLRPAAQCRGAPAPRLRLAALYPPELLAHTTVVAARCSFSLDELRYQYPMETVLPGTTPAQTLPCSSRSSTSWR
jgi:DNA polymerase III alpha subunit